jgi:hypothetical protein
VGVSVGVKVGACVAFIVDAGVVDNSITGVEEDVAIELQDPKATTGSKVRKVIFLFIKSTPRTLCKFSAYYGSYHYHFGVT